MKAKLLRLSAFVCTLVVVKLSAVVSFIPVSTSGVLLTRERTSLSLGSLPRLLEDDQIDFISGYLNKHHGDLLVAFAKVFTSLGHEEARRNAFSGGSYRIRKARVTNLPRQGNKLGLEVTITIRSQGDSIENVEMFFGEQNVASSPAVVYTDFTLGLTLHHRRTPYRCLTYSFQVSKIH